MHQLELFKVRFPQHAYATDDPQRGIRVYAAVEAIKRAIVQYNARNSVGWLVFDVDRHTAAFDWYDREAPAPNIIAVNQDNGHGHLFYALEEPVHKNEHSSQKAQRYAAAVQAGLTDKLEADRGYAHFLAKNPTHERWVSIFPRLEPWTLEELSDWVDLPLYQDRRRRMPKHGLGRNCNLFDATRYWAYAARRQPFLSEELYKDMVLRRALALNQDFATPLPHYEVRAVAKSVSQWTWRKMSPEGFKAYQKRVSALGNAKKSEKAALLGEEIRKARAQCPDLTQADLAAMFSVNQATVSRHLRDYAFPISDRQASGHAGAAQNGVDRRDRGVAL